MTLSLAATLGLTTRFHVVVDGVDLGGWGKCKGLGVDFKPEDVEEGGNYDYKPILPGRVEYTKITLTRAMDAAASQRVQQWLSMRIAGWVHSPGSAHGAVAQGLNAVGSLLGDGGLGGAAGGTGQITLFDSGAKPVITWQLRNVYPSKWSGPELDTTTFGIAMESLELVHEGFL